MEFIKITDSCYYFNGPVNIGYIYNGEEGLLIDAGLEASAMKKVLKHLDANELPINYLFITHAHADHYGGARYLQQNRDVYTVAPEFEEAILRNPILEPMYLFQGNHPISELRNKFLEGESIAIDRIVREEQVKLGKFQFQTYLFPGHSDFQLGVLFDEILYASDAYFSVETLKKHKIPYLIDADDAIQSLNKLLKVSCKGAIPGHGEFESNFHQTVKHNISIHLEVAESIFKYIEEAERGISQEELVKKACDHWAVNLKHLSSYLLYRTAITSYLIKLIKENKVEYKVVENRLTFKKKKEEAD